MDQRQARYMEAIKSLEEMRQGQSIGLDWQAFIWLVTATQELWDLVEPCIEWDKLSVDCKDQLYRMVYDEQLVVRAAQSLLEGWTFQVSLAAIAELPKPYFGAIIEAMYILRDEGQQIQQNVL